MFYILGFLSRKHFRGNNVWPPGLKSKKTSFKVIFDKTQLK